VSRPLGTRLGKCQLEEKSTRKKAQKVFWRGLFFGGTGRNTGEGEKKDVGGSCQVWQRGKKSKAQGMMPWGIWGGRKGKRGRIA